MSFSLDHDEADKLRVWLAEHNKTCAYAPLSKRGAIGGCLTYSFSPNSLGTVVKVKCACSAECDVTDYNW